MPTYSLKRADTPLVAEVELDDLTRETLRPFDLDPEVATEFCPWLPPEQLPGDFALGVIVGASGSGKSTLLDAFGGPTPAPEWHPRRTLASHFADPEDAADRFYAVGLNAVPVWRLPYRVLSNGQQFRADLARVIGDGAVVDEFTSVVDRNVAVGASKALSAWVRRRNVRGMVLATCHRDVIPWLDPDWIIDTDAGTLTVGRALDARPRWYADYVKPEGMVGHIVLA